MENKMGETISHALRIALGIFIGALACLLGAAPPSAIAQQSGSSVKNCDGQTSCLENLFRNTDQQLNAVYRDLQRSLDPGQKSALGDAQRAIRLVRSRARDVDSRLRAIGKGYVAFALAHPAYFRVIFGGSLPEEAHSGELRAAGQEAYDVLRELVAEGVADGTLRAGDPDELSLAAWSLVHGLSMLALGGQLRRMSDTPEAIRKVAATVLGFLIDGIARR
jgi:uncharacterized protein YecT (DUF1311 family)